MDYKSVEKKKPDRLVVELHRFDSCVEYWLNLKVIFGCRLPVARVVVYYWNICSFILHIFDWERNKTNALFLLLIKLHLQLIEQQWTRFQLKLRNEIIQIFARIDIVYRIYGYSRNPVIHEYNTRVVSTQIH